MELVVNQSYASTPSITVEPNQCYGPTTLSVPEPEPDELYVKVDDGKRVKDATQGEHLLQGMKLTQNQAYASTQSPNVITVEPNQCYVTTTSQSGLNPDQLYVGVEDHFDLTESQAYEIFH
jgi:hypothetical protein